MVLIWHVLLVASCVNVALGFSSSLGVIAKGTSISVLSASTGDTDKGSREAGSDRDLTGHKLWITFTGFDVVDMNFAIELNKNFKAVYSRGIEAREPGFWRCVKYNDGKETLEVTHPLLPDYLYFFDIWEANILWRGELNMEMMRVENGEVITNKKRLGLFPYTDVLATFTADLLGPKEQLPNVVVPELKYQSFVMPNDFNSPSDMKKYPEIFDKEYVEWMFQVEDATIRGEEPPPRPKAIFVPSTQEEGANENHMGFVGDAKKKGGKIGPKGEQVGGKLRKRKK